VRVGELDLEDRRDVDGVIEHPLVGAAHVVPQVEEESSVGAPGSPDDLRGIGGAPEARPREGFDVDEPAGERGAVAELAEHLGRFADLAIVGRVVGASLDHGDRAGCHAVGDVECLVEVLGGAGGDHHAVDFGNHQPEVGSQRSAVDTGLDGGADFVAVDGDAVEAGLRGRLDLLRELDRAERSAAEDDRRPRHLSVRIRGSSGD